MSIYDNVGHVSDVIVKQSRYDELLHKEALLESIERLYYRTTGYAFHDTVGCLFKVEKVRNDEQA